MNDRKDHKILSSKKLTSSFSRNTDCKSRVWESMGLSKREAKAVISKAIDKMKPSSQPLTITITINGEDKNGDKV